MKDMPLGAFLVMGALDEHADGLTARELVLATRVPAHPLFLALGELDKHGMVIMTLDTEPPRVAGHSRTVRRYVATPIGVMLYREEKAVFDKITGRAA